jgi:hypothetical protein
MPFIEKSEAKPKTKHVNVQLEVEVVGELAEYVKFIGKPQSVVVNEILLEVFRRDKDFGEFKKSKSAKVATIGEAQSAAG